MRKIILSSLIVLASGAIAYAEPVMRTSLDEALRDAPVIVMVEAGKRQYDDLKEGEEVKTTAITFESRKQSFKILKVYRNKTSMKLTEGAVIDLNYKSNSCLEFSIVVRKVQGKLQMICTDRGAGREPQTVEVKNTLEKDVLFLTPGETNPKILEHYGWFVSPQKFTDELDKKLKV